MAKADLTPEQVLQKATEALELMVQYATTIAHVKRSFYDAYISEGFTKEEALELCKNIMNL
jgi:hypothetical protein